MPNKLEKSPRNTAGAFYVDTSCIDCDLCRELAPTFFKRDEDAGLSYVIKQPEGVAEMAEAEEARNGCPTESIGNDG